MQMAGYPMPSAEAAQKFQCRFHEEELTEPAQRGTGGGPSELYPEERAPLRSLASRHSPPPDTDFPPGTRAEPENAAVVRKIEDYLAFCRTDSPEYPVQLPPCG